MLLATRLGSGTAISSVPESSETLIVTVGNKDGDKYGYESDEYGTPFGDCSPKFLEGTIEIAVVWATIVVGNKSFDVQCLGDPFDQSITKYMTIDGTRYDAGTNPRVFILPSEVRETVYDYVASEFGNDIEIYLEYTLV